MFCIFCQYHLSYHRNRSRIIGRASVQGLYKTTNIVHVSVQQCKVLKTQTSHIHTHTHKKKKYTKSHKAFAGDIIISFGMSYGSTVPWETSMEYSANQDANVSIDIMV
jgi:hypothetical protein